MDTALPIVVRTRKFLTNRLLSRRQMVVDVLHPGRANISKAEVCDQLASIYKAEKSRITAFGFRTSFGGGHSTGFALIYDSEELQKKLEPRHRLVQSGFIGKIEKPSRKLRKERKNRAKKLRGTTKSKASDPVKKAK